MLLAAPLLQTAIHVIPDIISQAQPLLAHSVIMPVRLVQIVELQHALHAKKECI